MNNSLGDYAYMVNQNIHELSKYDWVLDSATTSHICTIQDAFIDYELLNSEVDSIDGSAITQGRGTVAVNFKIDGQSIRHILRNVLHVPMAPNCLPSIPHLVIGGWVEFRSNGCHLHDKNNRVIGKEKLTNILYLLDACTELPNGKSTQYASIRTHSWDQWHRHYGHISINAIKSLKLNQMVDGLKIDESTFPSESCKACIQAKQAHKPFPQEAKN
jgi:hypothetical protein